MLIFCVSVIDYLSLQYFKIRSLRSFLYVASLTYVVHSIPLAEEWTTGRGGDENLSLIIFQYENWNGEQQAL